jgi:hypothetical protein
MEIRCLDTNHHWLLNKRSLGYENGWCRLVEIKSLLRNWQACLWMWPSNKHLLGYGTLYKHSELLGLGTFSIVRYSRNKKIQRFLRCRWEDTWGWKQIHFLKRCVFLFLEYRTTKKVPKPTNSESFTPLSEPFRIYYISSRSTRKWFICKWEFIHKWGVIRNPFVNQKWVIRKSEPSQSE